MSVMSDLMPNAAAREVIEDVGVQLESLRLLINKECRSWPEFIAVLKPPQLNLKHIEQRMTTNLLHYRVNYIVICLGVYVLQIVFHPVLLLALLVVLFFSFYTIFVLKKPVVVGDSVTINENGVKMITIALSVLFLMVMGSLTQLLWASIEAFLLCGLHMLLRPRSVTSKTNKLYEDMQIRGYGGFSSWGGGAGGMSNGSSIDESRADNAVNAMEAGSAGSQLQSSQTPLLTSGIIGTPKKD